METCCFALLSSESSGVDLVKCGLPAVGGPREGEEERKGNRRGGEGGGTGGGRERRGMRDEAGGGTPQGSECHSVLSAGGSPRGSLPVGLCWSLKEMVILGGSMIGSLESRKLSGD